MFVGLKGGLKTLEKYKPELFIEIENNNLLQYNIDKSELLSFLDKLGYKIKNIINDENHHFSCT
jgi:arsenate reductase-like glutaredoxin family protein